MLDESRVFSTTIAPGANEYLMNNVWRSTSEDTD